MLNLFRRSNPPARSAPIGSNEARQFASQVAAEQPPRRRRRPRSSAKWAGEVVRLTDELPPPRPTTEEHAVAFLRHLQRRQELQRNWIPAIDARHAYFDFCREVGWRPRSWAGRYGVAAALGRITVHRHKRIEVGDEIRDLRLYLVPPTLTAGSAALL